MFSKQPTMKLTISGKHDILQLGKGKNAFNDMNILSSLLRKRGSEKRSLVNEYSATYDWEIRPWLNTSTSLEFRRIFSNMFVPMDRVVAAADGSSMDTVSPFPSASSRQNR